MQLDLLNEIFDLKPFKIDKPIYLVEMFGGIGSQHKALKNIGANIGKTELIEFDKYAVQSYNAVHGTNFTTKDIREVRGGAARHRKSRTVLHHVELLVPLYRFINGWRKKRNGKRQQY